MRFFGFRFMTMLLLTLGLALGLAPQAQAATHIRPSLIAESAVPAPGGTVTLALLMQPDKGWHGYWKNPGDAGAETRIEWSLPKGARASELRYPVPRTLIVSGLMNYVYEADYAHLATLTLPKGIAPGTKLPIRAKVDWLACTDQICVPEKAELSIDLVAGNGAIDPGQRARFDRWRAAMPRPLGSAASFATAGDRFRLAVPLPAALKIQEAYFFPLDEDVIDYAAPQKATRNGNTLIVETKARVGGAALARVQGVVRIGEGRGLVIDARRGPVPAAGMPVAAVPEGSEGGPGAGGGARTLLLALGGALLGGLLLNVMPCVFPILSLKALSLARAGGNGREARREALAYSAGVVLVCLALGGTLLALRAGGVAVGWAFQLQDSRVILFLLLLVLAIALNLAGLFELPAITGGSKLAQSGGTGGAFWTGALAAFVATPCTGPFMAAALGAALILPWFAALAVFAGLGIGLALPFLLLGYVPALRRLLPRPGAWMDTLRHILSVPMFLTALGLAWIAGRQAGVDAMTIGLAAALLVGLALWLVGARQLRGAGHAWWPLAPAVAAAALLLAVAPRHGAAEAAPAVAAAGEPTRAPFSEERLAALRAEGKPVFVYFTADWCLTCKVNEKAAIERADVADAFHKRGVAVLVGDWTDGDAAIGRFLEAHGRSGVPLYLFYKRGGGAQVLPQILTPSLLVGLAAA
ncbi:protein-disulfide reductase DsbD family protein [Flavisphingomonas formosensis]|uniref:protein-disulfide reductase DsbD family protein n=1 Tax=Flavisphingomonas formosensis TaxID=861534 RepID=UPI0012F7B7DD|nr:protein-disulfide reductase DsbD domain-containing protein [Sphingomonas formosensis]